MSDTKITLYYASWCKHCKNFMPIWTNLETKIDSMTGFSHKKIESVANPDIMKSEDIGGYPTIKIIKNHISTEYKGSFNEESILNALKGGSKSKGSSGGSGRYYRDKYRKYKTKYINLKTSK